MCFWQNVAVQSNRRDRAHEKKSEKSSTSKSIFRLNCTIAIDGNQLKKYRSSFYRLRCSAKWCRIAGTLRSVQSAVIAPWAQRAPAENTHTHEARRFDRPPSDARSWSLQSVRPPRVHEHKQTAPQLGKKNRQYASTHNAHFSSLRHRIRWCCLCWAHVFTRAQPFL